MSGSILRDIIKTNAETNNLNMKDLTVLSACRDPYRLDTPANHILGQWLKDAYREVHDTYTRIHLRGLHYKLVGRVNKPNGQPYINTDENWLWFSEKVAKAARYLEYIPWDAVRDARNSPPQIFTPDHTPLEWRLLGAEVELYLPDDITPKWILSGDMSQQPWRQIVIAEKQGVEDLLLPVCRRRQATLCMPTGEISDTLVYDLLADGYGDGRPVAIHQLGDFDPAGYQMAVSTARKVQALVDTQFPEMQVVVHTPAMNLEQCKEWGLPDTPLKEKEKRGDKWRAAHGWNQTELDAAVALKPRQFADIIDESLLQYFDESLDNKAIEEEERLVANANEDLVSQLGEEKQKSIRVAALSTMEDLEEMVSDLNKEMYIDHKEQDISAPATPAMLVGDVDVTADPLIDTNGDWVRQTKSLINRKKYK